jgi:hypothetical protein
LADINLLPIPYYIRQLPAGGAGKLSSEVLLPMRTGFSRLNSAISQADEAIQEADARESHCEGGHNDANPWFLDMLDAAFRRYGVTNGLPERFRSAVAVA